jgi:4-amino-4-deoxychorismate lyase
MTDCLVDGVPGSMVPADDRGLLYGDGLFETIAFHHARAPLWDRHWARLSADARRLGLSMPPEDLARSECLQLAGSERCVIRLTLTRGSGGIAYFPDPQAPARRIVQRRAWPERLVVQRSEGMKLVTSTVRLARDSTLAGIKHLNRLEQVQAARDCAARGADEALLYDAAERLVEAIACNVILVIGSRKLTPRLDGSGVAGVGLRWLSEQPEVELEIIDIAPAQVLQAEEIMVINSVTGIRPVTALDDHRFAIGATCRAWQRLWSERLES